MQAEVALHKLQITPAELDQAWLRTIARLSKTLHLPGGLRLTIQPKLDETTLPGKVDNLVALIEHCHPQLDVQWHEIFCGDAAARLAVRNYYPDVNLGFNWHAIGSDGLSPGATGNDAYSLMVGVNLPVYRQKRDAALHEARFKTAQSA